MNITEQVYRADLNTVTCIVDMDTAQREELIVRAQSGEVEARDTMILSLLPVIFGYALRLQRVSMPALELIGVGNVTLVEHLDQALQEPSPYAYLLKFAKGEMINYRRRYCNAITVPTRPGDEPYTIASIIDDFDSDQFDIAEDEPVSSSHIDTAPLYEALAALPTESAQTFMVRAFGLAGQEPESLSEIAGGNSTTNAYAAAKARRLGYLRRMSHYLSKHYPGYVRWYTSKKTPDKSTPYAQVQIPAVTLRKLQAAKELLEARNETLSMNKLRKISGVNTLYASAFLSQLRQVTSRSLRDVL